MVGIWINFVCVSLKCLTYQWKIICFTVLISLSTNTALFSLSLLRMSYASSSALEMVET